MARQPRAKKQTTESVQLRTALEFVSVASRDTGAPYQSHTVLANNYAVAFDGVLAAGYPIHEDLRACPHTTKLRDALKRAGKELTITHLDSNRLSIKGGAFRALIPCASFVDVPTQMPDPNIAPVTDALRKAVEIAGTLATDGAETVIAASILWTPQGTAVATNRQVMIEVWHGLSVPPAALPKSAVLALAKAPAPLVGLGYSGGSVTFHFEGGAWLRSQLFQEGWPDVSRILDIEANYQPIPEKLFEGISAVEAFSVDGLVYFRDGIVGSHSVDTEGAIFEVPGLVGGSVYSIKQLHKIEPYATHIDLRSHTDKTPFMGESLRGVIMQVRG